MGVFYGIRELLSLKEFCDKFHFVPGVAGKKIIVQGIGNVGYWAAKFCEDGGATIIGLVEYNSSIVNPDGLNVDDAANYFRAQKSFQGYPKAKEVKVGEQIMDTMYLDCDILIPAAIENTLTKYAPSHVARFNVAKVRAKMVAEGANGPTTFAAQQHFDSKGVPVVPDFVLNAGGVTVSYFEWLKDLEHSQLGRLTKRWDAKSNASLLRILGVVPVPGSALEQGPTEKQIVYTALQDAMSKAVRDVFKKSQELNCSMRTAGYVLAIQRIAQVYADTGIF